MKLINKLLTIATCFLAVGFTSCEHSKIRIQILMTSDMHGMLVPYDYALDEDVTKKGSVSQVGTIINSLRDSNTIVIDCGDAIQGNYADIFVEKDKDTTHPMIEALNKLKYDIFVTGNHEYNYGMEYLQKQISKFKGTVLTGNVSKRGTYEPLADSYKIINKNGIKVAVIGMTSPLIRKWDGDKLTDWIVTDPINETKKIVKHIKENKLADVIVAAEHLGMPKENDEEGTSCRDLATVCPDIDVILGAHQHKCFEKEIVNGVLLCENNADAQTLMKIDIDVQLDNYHEFKVVNKDSKKINVGEYKTNSIIDEFAKPYDAKAKDNARTVIGKLEGNDPMSPLFEIESVPSTFMKPTALVGIVNKVQLNAAKSETKLSQSIRDNIKVASTAIGNYHANLKPGDIRKCDCCNIYKYANTLYVLKMNGKQLKQYMEWATQFYKKYQTKDLTISFVSDFPLFNYDMFTGVDYVININEDVGNRIEDLKWSDTKQLITENEEFYIAVNNYRANTNLLTKGTVYKNDDTLPEFVMSDLHQGKGIREFLADYITAQKKIRAIDYDFGNWSIKDTGWDSRKHDIAVNKINNKELSVGDFNTITITEDMI